MLRVLTIVVGVLAVLYGGYWFVGSRTVERAARAAIDGLKVRGWTVSYDDLATRGFPSRFDTGIDGLSLAAPGGGAEYAAQRIEVMALSYRPNEVIAVWPQGQRLAVPGVRATYVDGLLRFEATGAPSEASIEQVAATGPLLLDFDDSLRASARVRVGGDLALDAVTIEGGGEDPLILVDGPDYVVQAERFLGALRHAGEAPGSYEVFAEAQGLRLGAMADSGNLRIEAAVTLDRPLDRRLAEAPRVESWGLPSLDLKVGRGSLALVGNGAVAADGTLSATLTLTVSGWDAILAAAREAGIVDEGTAVFYARFLEEAAQGGETAEVPFVIEEGVVSAMGLPFGFVPPVASPVPGAIAAP